MAADFLAFGLEQAASVSLALVIVLLLRGVVRQVFSARSAYALWLIVPAMMLAVAAPRLDDTGSIAQSPSIATQVAQASAASTPLMTPTVVSDIAQWTPAISAADLLAGLTQNAAALLALWAAGAAAFAVLMILGQGRFIRALGTLRREDDLEGAIFHAKAPAMGPALVGALRPRIVVPADFRERFSHDEQALILAHERIHLRGGDAQINLAAAAFQAAFWFNPLAHIGARLLRVDQELACDEVIAARFPNCRRLYAQAMLKTQLCDAAAPLGCHWLAGRKVELRRRIERLNQTPNAARSAAGLALAGTAVLVGAATAWAAQPAQRTSQPRGDQVETVADRALIQAVENGQVGEAARLIAAGASADATSRRGASALLLAVESGELSLTRRLLDGGANPNLAVTGDGTALIIAAKAGDVAIAQLLLQRGADPNLASIGDGNPLINAAGSGHVEMVDLLLKSGAQINASVLHDETALITASRRGRLDAVRRLVEAGADVNKVVMAPRAGLPAEARSALSMARRSGRTDIVDYLRAHGARA
ncbi:MAG: M56 family metallopeptidase [Caulobacter sp.]